MTNRTLALALLVAFTAAGCKKPETKSTEKKKDQDDEGSKVKKKKGGDDKADDEEPKKAGKGGAGCKLPEHSQVNADWTLSKGCSMVVKDTIHVAEGATLTIEAGVTLKFETNLGVWIDYGKIVAKGTADEPIVLTSNNKSPGKGDWSGVRFADKTSAGTVFDNVKFEYTGHDDNGKAAISSYGRVSPGRLSITNCTFDHAEDGIQNDHEDAAFGKVEGNSFKGVEGVAMRLHASSMGSIGKNKLAGKAIQIQGPIKVSQTWPEVDGPVVLIGNVNIAGATSAAIVKIADKTVVKVNAGLNLWIGGDNGGGLKAKEVTFTSSNATPAAGDWSGLVIDKKVTQTKIEDCVISYAGHDEHGKGGVRWYETSPKEADKNVEITGCTFDHILGPAFHQGEGGCGKAAEPASKNKITGGKLCGE